MHCWQSNTPVQPCSPYATPYCHRLSSNTCCTLFQRQLPVSSPKSPAPRENEGCVRGRVRKTNAFNQRSALERRSLQRTRQLPSVAPRGTCQQDFSPPPRSFGSSPYFLSRLTCTSTAILGHCLKLGRRCPLPLEDEFRETHQQPGFFLSGFISPLYSPGCS